MATIASVLGSRLKRYWAGGVSPSSWRDEIGVANAVQATSARQPTVVSTLASRGALSFSSDGSFSTDADVLVAAPAGASSSPRYTLVSGCFLLPSGFATDGSGAALFQLGDRCAVYIYPGLDNSLRLAGFGNTAFAYGAPNVNDDRWHPFVGLWDAASSTCRLWLDEVEYLNSAGSDTTPPDLSTLTIYLGAGFSGGEGAFQGLLSNVVIAQDTSAFTTTDETGDVAQIFAAQREWIRAVQFGSSGAAATGTTSASVAYPSGIVAGDMLVLAVTNKYPSNGPSTPSGWTLPTNGQGSGGAGAAGADSGSVYTTVFYKIATGLESGNLSVSAPSGNSTIARMFRYTAPSGYAWDTPVAAHGADNTAGTAFSVTAGTAPGFRPGDVVVVAAGTNTDARTHSGEAISATGVTAWGTAIERQDSAAADGDDCSLAISEHYVHAGTSNSAPVFSMTASGTTANQNAGAAVILRLRALPTMSAAQGSFSLAGNAAGVTAQRKIAAAQGGFSLAGQNAGLIYAPGGGSYSIAANQGSFGLSGNAAGLRAARRIVAAAGSLSIVGQTANLRASRRIVAASGTILLAGQAVALRCARKVVAAQGAFAIAGQAATLVPGRKVIAAQGSFALAGIAATLRSARRIVAQQGAITLAGQAAALRASRRVAALMGTFSLNGQNATFIVARRLIANAGTFALAGQNATLIHSASSTLVAATGIFAVSGQAVGLRAARRLTANHGAFALAGQAASLLRGRRMVASTGSLSLVGQPASLLKSRVMLAGGGTFMLVGSAVGLRSSRRLVAATGTVVMVGISATLRRDRFMLAAPGTFSLIGTAVQFDRDRRLVAATGLFGLVGFDARLLAGLLSDIATPIIRWALRAPTLIAIRQRSATIITVSQRSATLITVRQAKMPYVDDKHEVIFTFQHPDTKEFIDPPSVLLVVQSPAQVPTNSVTTYEYGTDDAIAKLKVGWYRGRIPCTEKGKWTGAPKCTGDAASSGQFYFDVEPKLGT